jgi:hypothetical protein
LEDLNTAAAYDDANQDLEDLNEAANQDLEA